MTVGTGLTSEPLNNVNLIPPSYYISSNVPSAASSPPVALKANHVDLTRCVLINARSLRNKLSDLQALLSVSQPGLVFVTESWLEESIADGMIDPSGSFAVYRHDRAARVGGGVLALVSKQFNSYRLVLPNQFLLVEVECFELVTDFSIYRFIIVYRPPDFNSIGRDYAKRLHDCLRYLCDTHHTVFIVGDLNLPNINWADAEAPDDNIHSLFLKFCSDYGFEQYVTEPTRDSHVLDLVLCNDPFVVSELEVTEPFSNSDHCMVKFDLVLTSHEHSGNDTSHRPVYDFSNSNADAISYALSVHPFQFTVPEDNVNADDIWSQFITPIYKAIDDFVPIKVRRPNVMRTSAKKKYPKHIARALRKKAALWRKYRCDKSLCNKTAFYEQVEICRSLIFEHERTKELQVINKSNIGAFYRYVNKRLGTSSGVGPLRSTSTGIIFTDESAKAGMLNDYFSSIFVDDDGKLPEFVRRVPDSTCMDSFDVTPDRILYFINKSKPGTSPGPDGIPASFIKQFKYELLRPVFTLYCHLVAMGQIPAEWKLANITPVLKTGIASDVSNYRPISLTSVFCQLFERVLQEKVLVYLFNNKLISKQQHGFLAKHSTCTQLLETINDWSIALSNSNVVDIMYFDIAKAFDTVSHVKLLHKLQAYGFHGRLLSIFAEFLGGRFQRVMLPGGSSSWKPVLSGVPQGSVIGPLLFLLYINDIADFFPGKTNIKLFADDIKIYMEINDYSECESFQRSIDTVLDWAKKWQLKLSLKKCHYMRVSLRKSSTCATYLLSDAPLNPVASIVDLGVHVDCRLSFSGHINNIVARAKRRASQILRCFLSKDPNVLTKAFVVYVRPLLEYCSSVWSPSKVSDINKLESVQRSFTKRLVGFRHMTYDNRLKLLGLDRLELRRLRADLVTCYKIFNGLLDIPFDSFFRLADYRSTRGHALKLFLPDSRINARAYSFPVRVVTLWNRLPASTVLARNLKQFKIAVRITDLSYAILGKL